MSKRAYLIAEALTALIVGLGGILVLPILAAMVR